MVFILQVDSGHIKTSITYIHSDMSVNTVNSFKWQPKSANENMLIKIKGEYLSIQLKQKRHVYSFHLFFQVREKPILLFKYKQKFTHCLWKNKSRWDTCSPPGISLALLSLFKNLWIYAACCSLEFLNCVFLCFPHWTDTTCPLHLADSNFCDSHGSAA